MLRPFDFLSSFCCNSSWHQLQSSLAMHCNLIHWKVKMDEISLIHKLAQLNHKRKLNRLDLSKSAKDQWKSESCLALTSFHFIVKTVSSCLALTFWKIKQKPIRGYVMYHFLKVAKFRFSFYSAGSLKPGRSISHPFNLFWLLQLQIKCPPGIGQSEK